MKERIKKDRDFLLIFSLLWVGSVLWIIRHYPLIKDFDFSKLSAVGVNLLALASFASLFSLVATAVYVYRMYKWYNSPQAPARLMALLFLITSIVFGFVSLIIVIAIIWKSKKLLIDKQDASGS
jgi:hypothetical protein